MRVKFLLAVVFSIALAAVATSAFAAPGGQPGKPDEPGKSAEAPGHNKGEAGPSDSSKDPSNPDGTYQGKSPSTPDQDGIGADHGIDNNDKTGPDTDGNNGCGNDPDREDDNNGWCGKKPAPEVSPTENPTVSPSPTAQAQVLGVKLVKPEAEVLGLALTGAGLVIPIAMGSVLLMMGLGIRAIAKQPR
jgi:hypothetical protein